MINFKQFDELRKAQPFRPFRIIMSDGAAFIVPHPEFTWRAPNGSTVVVATEDGEVAHLVDPLHITRFEFVRQNGKASSRRRSNR
jgi:hypothetical protein